MKLVTLNSLFDIVYGNQYDLYKLYSDESSDINFVSRSRENLGVVKKVSRVDGVDPFPAGLITVTLGGTYLLSSFVQPEPFYTAQNVKVLTPIEEMSFGERIFYCKAIEANRFRYTSHGREANLTLDTLLVPSAVPVPYRVNEKDALEVPSGEACTEGTFTLNTGAWDWFRYDELFEIKKGKRILKSDTVPGDVPCVRPIDANNGVDEFIQIEPNHEANTISINYNGSVGEAFYQPEPFFAVDDVNVLYPKFQLDVYVGLFFVCLIRKERYRYNYGRKWHLARMNSSLVKLPVDSEGNPDFEFIRSFIKSLPFSRHLSPTNG